MYPSCHELKHSFWCKIEVGLVHDKQVVAVPLHVLQLESHARHVDPEA